MGSSRLCTRTACGQPAVATLTYVYADSTVVLGPLALYPEPHTYDLCGDHAQRLTAPRGWEVVRLHTPQAGPVDDLAVLADIVRQPRSEPAPAPAHGQPAGGQREPGQPLEAPSSTGVRRGHLRILREQQP
ncbi:hypothetical protein GCM10011512_19750 [Tersicoccus solisilvae]|uniref:DUF3499 domain-containing protein n=1 Tax=Tersicoccus solisilvae TaxID=1882339 RepID=A0ABQ1P7Q8_9MICC|nr:DUF3499 domain-containing protein [Tersicoccus solisilvae]GGC92723.1 hypothetical protein GCM10011512_19750 [Tersicoccus solisilvae]